MRLIDAGALRKQFEELYNTEEGYDRIICRIYLEAIDDSPTIEAAPVVHGRWEQAQRWAAKAKYRCSVCGREIMSATKVNIEKYPYCHCGARMDGDGGA